MSDKSIRLSRPTRRFSHDSEIAYRRERVLTWTAQGRHTRDIAAELNVNERTIKRDLHFLMDKARDDIKSYMQDKLPWEYQKSLSVLDEIKLRAFNIADKTDIADRDKIPALRLAAETEVSRARLLAECHGVVSMQDINERIAKLENYEFQKAVRQQLPLTR
jgi:DNA-binding CsgD family transcriptional regulator